MIRSARRRARRRRNLAIAYGSPGWEAKTVERFLARVAAQLAHQVTLVRLSSIVCPGGPCPMVVHGIELRPGDGGHLSIDGAQAVAGRLIDGVVEAANRVA